MLRQPGSARVGARPSRIASATAASLPGRAWNRAKMNSSMSRLLWVSEAQARRVKSMIQFVSHVRPPSGENACSQWHAVGVIPVQR